MTGTFPEGWEEVALVTIQRKGGTAYEFMAMTETIDIAQGDYPGESMPTLSGGRIWKQSAEEDGEITLEVYPTDISVADNTGLFQQFAGRASDGTYDTAQPLASNTTFIASAFDLRKQRDKFIVAIMWTDDVAVAAATAATTTADAVALRFYAKEARVTSHKAEFTDGILKVTVTFKYPAMNKAGTTKSWAWESTNDGDGAQALPALTYT